ncbi:MAG: entericidin [Rickettsiales bacterium]|nr:entericidin [Rickettsiales bacterium]
MIYRSLALLFILAISACNTVDGLGQDVRQAGEWTSDSAKKVKDEMK